MPSLPDPDATVTQLRARASRHGVTVGPRPDHDTSVAVCLAVELLMRACGVRDVGQLSSQPEPVRRVLARVMLRACGQPPPDGGVPPDDVPCPVPSERSVAGLVDWMTVVVGSDVVRRAARIAAQDLERSGAWPLWEAGQLLAAATE